MLMKYNSSALIPSKSKVSVTDRLLCGRILENLVWQDIRGLCFLSRTASRLVAGNPSSTEG
jgi:hypothetical protein